MHAGEAQVTPLCRLLEKQLLLLFFNASLVVFAGASRSIIIVCNLLRQVLKAGLRKLFVLIERDPTEAVHLDRYWSHHALFTLKLGLDGQMVKIVAVAAVAELRDGLALVLLDKIAPLCVVVMEGCMQ